VRRGTGARVRRPQAAQNWRDIAALTGGAAVQEGTRLQPGEDDGRQARPGPSAGQRRTHDDIDGGGAKDAIRVPANQMGPSWRGPPRDRRGRAEERIGAPARQGSRDPGGRRDERRAKELAATGSRTRVRHRAAMARASWPAAAPRPPSRALRGLLDGLDVTGDYATGVDIVGGRWGETAYFNRVKADSPAGGRRPDQGRGAGRTGSTPWRAATAT